MRRSQVSDFEAEDSKTQVTQVMSGIEVDMADVVIDGRSSFSEGLILRSCQKTRRANIGRQLTHPVALLKKYMKPNLLIVTA
jgi:hypothetical protein